MNDYDCDNYLKDKKAAQGRVSFRDCVTFYLKKKKKEDYDQLMSKFNDGLIPVSFHKGASEQIVNNKLKMEARVHREVKKGYVEQLKTMETDILYENKKYLVQREILNLVQPEDLVNRQCHSLVKQV